MDDYSPKEYWANIADNFRSADPSGIAPVLHPGAPAWFNQLIDRQQFHALGRALALARIPAAARSLDVGCGTGRWVRRYEQMGFRATGLDVTPGMLRTARQCGITGLLVAGEAHRLPFSDGAFDFVSDVTVVQHIPAELQPAAIGEMMRVLKPKGHLLLFELIRGKGRTFSRARPRIGSSRPVRTARHSSGGSGKNFSYPIAFLYVWPNPYPVETVLVLAPVHCQRTPRLTVDRQSEAPTGDSGMSRRLSPLGLNRLRKKSALRDLRRMACLCFGNDRQGIQSTGEKNHRSFSGVARRRRNPGSGAADCCGSKEDFPASKWLVHLFSESQRSTGGT